jgi:hypothetical protein
MKPLIEVLTDQFTFAIFYGSFIALITLWAMALLTRRVRRLTNHVEGLQADLRIVNDALKTLTSAPVRREIGSIDGLLGVNPKQPSSPTLASELARAKPKLDIGRLDQDAAKPRSEPPASAEAKAPSPRGGSPEAAPAKPAAEPSKLRPPSAAALPVGAVRPNLVKTADASSIKLAAAKAAAVDGKAAVEDAKPAVKPDESGAKAAP